MDFLDRMQAGRDAAAARRHRGESTGKSAPGWDRKVIYPPAGTWGAKRLETRARWKADKGGAHAIYVRLVFPERLWNELDGGPELTMDDVMAELQRQANIELLATF